VLEGESEGADGMSAASTSVLDLGTGNGHWLFKMRQGLEGDSDDGYSEDEDDTEDGAVKGPRDGFKGRMLGVDYSQKSVEFARRIAASKSFGEDSPEYVEFRTWDLIKEPASKVLDEAQKDGWDLVCDKGTFDAISLSSELDAQGKRIVEGYRGKVVPLVRNGGFFLVTSCNWTEEELKGWFEGEGEGGKLEYVGRVEYRVFEFGGKKGQTISSVCFRKKAC
jgi:SAM-dependent methyltransferase